MLSIPQKSLRPEPVTDRSAATAACSIFLRLSNRTFEIRKEGQSRPPLTNQNRHLSDRLIRTIESNAEEFAHCQEVTKQSTNGVVSQAPRYGNIRSVL